MVQRPGVWQTLDSLQLLPLGACPGFAPLPTKQWSPEGQSLKRHANLKHVLIRTQILTHIVPGQSSSGSESLHDRMPSHSDAGGRKTAAVVVLPDKCLGWGYSCDGPFLDICLYTYIPVEASPHKKRQGVQLGRAKKAAKSTEHGKQEVERNRNRFTGGGGAIFRQGCLSL